MTLASRTTRSRPPGRASRRPLAGIPGRSASQRIRWLTGAGTVQRAASGYYCQALFRRRGVTCAVFFDNPRRGLWLYGERRAAHYHVRIQDPPQEGETR
jgi:hypothetical protein